MTAEAQRLQENRERTAYWTRWGSYVSERQWGTVREDYSMVFQNLNPYSKSTYNDIAYAVNMRCSIAEEISFRIFYGLTANDS